MNNKKVIIPEESKVNFCISETIKHREKVALFIMNIITELAVRSREHDASKILAPELHIFAEYTPKLKNTTYGSEEYNAFLKEMQTGLEHHYKYNKHHPEHFENGIQGMNLIDLVEMFCDWFAAVKRHDDGDIYKSIVYNQKRFGYSDDLRKIFENTVKLF